MLEIAAMEDFPNLERQQDGAALVANAKAAVKSLRKWTAQYSSLIQAQEQLQREQEEQKAKYEARRSHARVLEELRGQFLAMHSDQDAQGRGRRFERLLNDLFFLYDLNPRKSFVIADEQIDGAFTFNTDDYIIEAKWGADSRRTRRYRRPRAESRTEGAEHARALRCRCGLL